MAVQLPTFADLPSLVPQPSGQLPNFSKTDPVAEGEANLGQGFQKAGLALSDTDLYQQLAKDKLEEANATVDLFSRVDPLKAQIAKETDPAKVAELKAQANDLLTTSGQAIANPLRRQMWTAQHSRVVNELNIDAYKRNTDLGREQAVADIHGMADKAIRTAVGSEDPQAMDIAQGAINDAAQYGRQYGAITPDQAYNFTKQRQAQLYVGKADQLIAQGRPDQASALLDAHREDIDQITLGRLQIAIAAKSRKINTDSAALEALGLPTTGLNVPVGSLPSDPTASTPVLYDGTGAPDRVDNWETQHNNFGGIRKAGVVAGPNAGGFEAYATPEEGVGDIKRLLTVYQDKHGLNTLSGIINRWAPPSDNNPTNALIARASKIVGVGPNDPIDLHDPGTMAKVIEATIRNEQGGKLPVSPAIIAKVAGAGEATSDQPQPQPAQSRTGLPSLTDAYMNILKNPRITTDEQVRQAFGTATTIHNAMEADAARAERLRTQQQQAALKNREDQIWADVYSPQPQITAGQVAVDPAFSGNPERRKAMIELINNPPGSAVPAAQSYSAALSLIDRIRLPEGDPNKITDEGQIYPLMRSLNRTDFDYVRKTLNDIRAPGGEALAKEEDRFFKDIGPFIDKSNPLAGSMDPAGKARLYEYHRWVDGKKDELKKAGKNPNDLFDPANPSYVGKPEIISYYQPSLTQSQQSIKDFATGVPKPLPPLAPWNPPPPIPPFTTEPIRQSGESAEDYLKRTGQQ